MREERADCEWERKSGGSDEGHVNYTGQEGRGSKEGMPDWCP